MPRLPILLLLLTALAGCAGRIDTGAPSRPHEPAKAMHYRAEGKASYYAKRHQGAKTASGEKYEQTAFTAAHRSLPFGTLVRVTNLKNNRDVVVRINDRGPFSKSRIIDLSRKAAQQLDMIDHGVVPVRVESLQ
jgi:rare lipoprotein A